MSKRDYLLGAQCPACEGNGRLPFRCDRWRTSEQEDGRHRIDEHATLTEALAYYDLRDNSLSGPCHLIAPDGLILTPREVDALRRERTPAPTAIRRTT